MTRFGHKLNYVINTFVKRTPEQYNIMSFDLIIHQSTSYRFELFIARSDIKVCIPTLGPMVKYVTINHDINRNPK